MGRLLLALLLAGLSSAWPSPPAAAQDGPDPCAYYAAQVALPYLLQSYSFTPAGYGPYGYAPLTYPFGVPGFGAAALFGPPAGLAPAFGPLGPGVTSSFLARTVLPASGFNPAAAGSAGTLVSLANLQQLELAQLNLRYSNSAYYQTAAATWAGGYATQAATLFNRAKADCQQQQHQSAARPTPAPAPGGS